MNVVAWCVYGALAMLVVVGWLKGAFYRSFYRPYLDAADYPYLFLYTGIALTAAFRLAHPASRWAGWFYGSDKIARGIDRYVGTERTDAVEHEQVSGTAS